ncbi:MAG: hypothetical protein GY828_08620 [Candidatus Gracilibacteria bacterium]|nr:hypothetical protein [Candidatus Gracilibacteria bacterium]
MKKIAQLLATILTLASTTSHACINMTGKVYPDFITQSGEELYFADKKQISIKDKTYIKKDWRLYLLMDGEVFELEYTVPKGCGGKTITEKTKVSFDVLK